MEFIVLWLSHTTWFENVIGYESLLFKVITTNIIIIRTGWNFSREKIILFLINFRSTWVIIISSLQNLNEHSRRYVLHWRSPLLHTLMNKIILHCRKLKYYNFVIITLNDEHLYQLYFNDVICFEIQWKLNALYKLTLSLLQ